MYAHVGREHERAICFDRLIEAADTALAHPAIAGALGDDAAQLSELLDQLYLPNVEDDVAAVPDDLADADQRIAFIPIDDSEASRALDFVQPLLQQTMGAPQVLPGSIDSVAWGMRVNTHYALQEANHWKQWRTDLQIRMNVEDGYPPLAPGESPFNAFRDSTLARVEYEFDVQAQEGIYRQTAPAILMRELCSQPGQCNEGAAILIHELTHVVDIRREGVVIDTSRGGASTEVHAYKNAGDVLRVYQDPVQISTIGKLAQICEAYGDPESPYTITSSEMSNAILRLDVL